MQALDYLEFAAKKAGWTDDQQLDAALAFIMHQGAGRRWVEHLRDREKLAPPELTVDNGGIEIACDFIGVDLERYDFIDFLCDRSGKDFVSGHRLIGIVVEMGITVKGDSHHGVVEQEIPYLRKYSSELAWDKGAAREDVHERAVSNAEAEARAEMLSHGLTVTRIEVLEVLETGPRLVEGPVTTTPGSSHEAEVAGTRRLIDFLTGWLEQGGAKLDMSALVADELTLADCIRQAAKEVPPAGGPSPKDFENVMDIFWQMLREIEVKTNPQKAPLDAHLVSSAYSLLRNLGWTSTRPRWEEADTEAARP